MWVIQENIKSTRFVGFVLWYRNIAALSSCLAAHVASPHPLEMLRRLRPINPDFVRLSSIPIDRNSAKPRKNFSARILYDVTQRWFFFTLRDIPKNYHVGFKEHNTLILSY